MLTKLAYPACAILILVVVAIINLRALREMLGITDGTVLYFFAVILLVSSFWLLLLLVSTENRERLSDLWAAKASLVIIIPYVFWGTYMLISLFRSTDL